MFRLLALTLATGLAACAAPASSLSVSPDDPSSAAAPSASVAVSLASLSPVAQPDLPAVLRSEPMADTGSMDHDAMDRSSMGHDAMDHDATAMGPLAEAVDAYLAVHDALAQDQTDPAAAAQLADLLRQSTEAAPPGDPHLWHRLGADVTTAQAAADALRRSETLDAARAAFGDLGVAFSALVTASGSGDGLTRHTCGMTDAPQGGVWLQRTGAVRNPFFGTAMLMCSRRTEAVTAEPARDR